MNYYDDLDFKNIMDFVQKKVSQAGCVRAVPPVRFSSSSLPRPRLGPCSEGEGRGYEAYPCPSR